MKNYWMMALALLMITAGCGPQESAERAAQDALQDQKVRAALTKQERGSMSMPAEVTPNTEAEDSDKDAEATKDTEPVSDKEQTQNSEPTEGSKPTKDSEAPADSEPQAKGEATTKADTAASPKVDAQEVFAAAIAAAKADDKALFVHFTADW